MTNLGNILIGSFFALQIAGGAFMAFFGFIMAGFAGGWATGDRVMIIIGLCMMGIGIAVTIAFITLMNRLIRGIL